MLLAHPARRQGLNMQNSQRNTGRGDHRGFRCDLLHVSAGPVTRAVVDRYDLERYTLLPEQRAESLPDSGFLVAGGHDNGKAERQLRRRVKRRFQ